MKPRTCTYCGYPKGMTTGKPDKSGKRVWTCEACKKKMDCERGQLPGPHALASLFRIGR